MYPVCVLQLKDDTARCEEEEAEKKVKLKAMREHHHKWEDTREGRVGTWRDFVKGKKTRVRFVTILVLHNSLVLAVLWEHKQIDTHHMLSSQ